MTDPLAPFAAVLLVTYGGPDGPEDVLPFMRNATRGRGVPDERLLEVSTHYQRFGGVSPINARNEELRAALAAELATLGSAVPVVVGNRNWHPFLKDTLADLADGGARRVLVLLASAYSSYSGCRQYREDLARAQGELRAAGHPGADIALAKTRPYFTTPGFIAAATDAVAAALTDLAADADPARTRLAFVTHSIPTAMEDGSGPPDRDGTVLTASYAGQHLAVCEQIAAALPGRLGRSVAWDLTYCSRSGSPRQPWLEPDINDYLEQAHDDGVAGVVAAPIGFITDHMEVVFDLDTEARETADRLDLPYRRAATVGLDPRFVASLVHVLTERAAQVRADPGTLTLTGPAEQACPAGERGDLGPWPTRCRPDCCMSAR